MFIRLGQAAIFNNSSRRPGARAVDLAGRPVGSRRHTRRGVREPAPCSPRGARPGTAALPHGPAHHANKGRVHRFPVGSPGTARRARRPLQPGAGDCGAPRSEPSRTGSGAAGRRAHGKKLARSRGRRVGVQERRGVPRGCGGAAGGMGAGGGSDGPPPPATPMPFIWPLRRRTQPDLQR